MELNIFFWLGLTFFVVIIIHYLLRNVKGCSGNCEQGRYPCDCGKYDT